MRPLANLAALLVAILAFATSTPVQAQTCSASFSSIQFGSVDVLPGAALNSAGSVVVSCSGISLATQVIRVCLGLNDGANASSAPRNMASQANRLTYDLYTDNGKTTRWTSIAAQEPFVDISLALPSRSLSVYGRIFAAQTSAPVGVYADSIVPAVRWGLYTLPQLPPSCLQTASR